METKVFLIEEHKETIFDSEKISEWENLVKELDLPKQAELLKPDKSPIPFPAMTAMQSTIYQSVLETQIDYKHFASEAIPLPALNAIALCEREHYFEKIEIWYSRQNPDPIVVGKNFASEEDKKNQYTWRMVPFMIAAWGPKLKPVSELLPTWKAKKLAEFKESYERSIADIERQCNNYDFQKDAFELSF